MRKRAVLPETSLHAFTKFECIRATIKEKAEAICMLYLLSQCTEGLAPSRLI